MKKLNKPRPNIKVLNKNIMKLKAANKVIENAIIKPNTTTDITHIQTGISF